MTVRRSVEDGDEAGLLSAACRLARPKLHVAHRPGDWTVVKLANGKRYEVQSWVGLWWSVFRERPVLVVASRRAPSRPGDHPGEVQFFYTTDLTMTPKQVLESYADRWAIECLFHEVKERMGFEEPQCRTEKAVERTAPFLLWTAGIVQYWFLVQNKPGLMAWRPRWRNRRKASARRAELQRHARRIAARHPARRI